MITQAVTLYARWTKNATPTPTATPTATPTTTPTATRQPRYGNLTATPTATPTAVPSGAPTAVPNPTNLPKTGDGASRCSGWRRWPAGGLMMLRRRREQ
ncbi:MAG: hypothetical protein ACLS6G_12140 [Christensenellales bacterium]